MRSFQADAQPDDFPALGRAKQLVVGMFSVRVALSRQEACERGRSKWSYARAFVVLLHPFLCLRASRMTALWMVEVEVMVGTDEQRQTADRQITIDHCFPSSHHALTILLAFVAEEPPGDIPARTTSCYWAHITPKTISTPLGLLRLENGRCRSTNLGERTSTVGIIT